MKEYKKMLKNAFNYSGRCRRREYWVPVLINSGIQMFLYGLMFLGATLAGDCLFYSTGGSVGFTTTGSTVATILCIPYVLFGVYAFITQLSLTVRRFHDTGKPGWAVALCLLGSCCCGIGIIVQFVFCCLDSKEDNEWGENPKNHNEYESGASIIGSVSFYVILLIFAVIAMVTNAFGEGSPYLSSQNGSQIAESTEPEDTEEITEEMETEEVESGEDVTVPDTEEDTEDVTVTADGENIIIYLDDYTQVGFPVPSELTVDSSSDTSAYLSADNFNLSLSSSGWSTKEEAIESLKDSYSPFNGVYDNLVEEECAEAVETTVSGNPVYYSKTVLDYGDEKNTMYHIYVDLGAEYLLEIDIDTYYDITDEQALEYAKFEQ